MVIDPAGGAPLTLLDVRKRYEVADGATLTVLDRFSIEVGPGELIAIVGPSGSGKSTLLRLIAGLDRPDSGTILAGGEPVDGPSADRGLVFQDPSLFPWLTVRRNLEFGPAARGRLRRDRPEVDAFLKLVGLEAFADQYPHQLSGGMAQRAALARALVNRPRILLLDEPFGALDPFTRLRMQEEVLRLWRARGTTIVMVTHDIDEAIALGDRIVLMTPPPGRVEAILEVPLDRPRDRIAPRFLRLRGEVLDRLHLTGVEADGAADLRVEPTFSRRPSQA